MAISSQDVQASLLKSFASAEKGTTPYHHWFLSDCLPDEALAATRDLPFPAPDLGGVSGKREVHNATRRYFDIEGRGQFEVVRAIADAFQDRAVFSAVESTFMTDLEGTYLRIEYAQDTDGFWLEPHTDLGVKLFTLLLYLSDGPGHEKLGTDIYDKDQKHVGSSPFAPNGAMVFVPSDDTYHGFERRPITGVRKSLIVNYVSDEWRAREQLAFPDQPIRH